MAMRRAPRPRKHKNGKQRRRIVHVFNVGFPKGKVGNKLEKGNYAYETRAAALEKPHNDYLGIDISHIEGAKQIPRIWKKVGPNHWQLKEDAVKGMRTVQDNSVDKIVSRLGLGHYAEAKVGLTGKIKAEEKPGDEEIIANTHRFIREAHKKLRNEGVLDIGTGKKGHQFVEKALDRFKDQDHRKIEGERIPYFIRPDEARAESYWSAVMGSDRRRGMLRRTHLVKTKDGFKVVNPKTGQTHMSLEV
jgi:hypothetical protein